MTTVQDDLQKCRVDGNIIYLPAINDTQLENYVGLKKALLNSGAKYKRSTFVFPTEAQPYVDRILGGKMNMKKEYQFFPTPEAVAYKMIDLIDWVMLPARDIRVLEPEAGQAALLKALIQKVRIKNSHVQPPLQIHLKIECYELMPENVAILEQLGHNVIGNDFMKAPVQPVYDLIIANPPFTKNQDIQHITKMYEMLAPNGQLITLASPSWTFNESIAHTAFKNFIEEECDMGRASWEELAAGEFKESGTNIRTTLIYMRKPLGL